MAARRSLDDQQSSIPPKEKGHFYRDPLNQTGLPGEFYSQQTEKPSGGKGNFYTRQPTDFKDAPGGHFYRDAKGGEDPPNMDEQGLGKTGRMPAKGVDPEVRALTDRMKKRNAKVKRQRGRL